MEHCPLHLAICWERHRSFIAHMLRLGGEAARGCDARTRRNRIYIGGGLRGHVRRGPRRGRAGDAGALMRQAGGCGCLRK
eukprot:scaffold106780_cov57-Phaeocystis_antarctica.AAC.1